jgi:hypothetical protein
MMSDTAIKEAREDAKGSWKRHKQRLQEAATTVSDDISNSK